MIPVEWNKEYHAARERVRRIVESAAEMVDATVPACPEWSVHDVVAHVCGLSVALSSGDMPSGDTQAWLDGLVDRRRDVPVTDLLQEWDAAADGIDAFLVAMGDGAGQLVYDVVAHEHDICHALGRPGDQSSSGVQAATVAMSALLAKDLAARSLAGVEITSGGRTWVVGDQPAGLAVVLEPFELIRVFGGRRSEAQVRAVDWRGDLDAYLPAIAHHPFPTEDLVE